jgi:AcrR family transcriptional regulator
MAEIRHANTPRRTGASCRELDDVAGRTALASVLGGVNPPSIKRGAYKAIKATRGLLSCVQISIDSPNDPGPLDPRSDLISLDWHSSIGLNDDQMKSTSRQTYTMVARAEGMAATRERIIQAALRLGLEQAYEDITLAAIAQVAGVSHQTVLNHFESKERVATAAAEVLKRETAAARDKATPSDVADAIAVLVGEYERFGDANTRWAISSERLGSLAALLDDARADHQAWLQRIFSDSLPTTPTARRRAVNALHAATDVYTWKLLRRDLRLTRADVETIMVNLVNGILKCHSAPRHRTRSRRGAR